MTRKEKSNLSLHDLEMPAFIYFNCMCFEQLTYSYVFKTVDILNKSTLFLQFSRIKNVYVKNLKKEKIFALIKANLLHWVTSTQYIRNYCLMVILTTPSLFAAQIAWCFADRVHVSNVCVRVSECGISWNSCKRRVWSRKRFCNFFGHERPASAVKVSCKS